MNVFNAIHNSTQNLIGLGPSPNGSTTATNNNSDKSQQQPHLLYFSIFNPSLIDQFAEDNLTLLKQIVIYLNFEIDREVSDNEKVKRIGIIQGLNDFSLKFLNSKETENTNLTHIDTDKSRIIVGRLENDYWFIAGFRFGKSNNTYLQRGLASPEYLQGEFIQGYKLWCLNYGSFAKNENLDNFNSLLQDWWQTWLNNRFEFNCNFNMNDKGFLNLINGYRLSSVQVPLGFKENLKNRMAKFINENDDLIDIFIINTNWTPSKNFGVVFLNDEDSKIDKQSLIDLINYLERLDSNFGLSTYSLTLNNLPSLKSYISNLKRLNSMANDGTLLERSLLEPAMFIHEQFTTHVFDPFHLAMNTMTNLTSSLMPNKILPKMNFLGFGGSSNVEEQQEGIDEPGNIGSTTDDTATRLNSSGAGTNGASIEENLESQPKTGNFLLGNTKDQTIISKKFFMKLADNEDEDERSPCDTVIYEINGILFTLLFRPDSSRLKELEYYNSLKLQLNEVFETYFKDLIVNQIKDLEENLKSFNKPKFYYILNDNNSKSYKTSLPNIPDDEEIKNLKVFASQQQSMFNAFSSGINRSQIVNLNINIIYYLINDSELINLVSMEKLIKLNKNWWCLFKRFNKENKNKTLIILKKVNNKELNFDCSDMILALGNDVKEWYENGIRTGLLD